MKHIWIAMVALLTLSLPVWAQEASSPTLENIRVRFCNDESVVGGTKTITLSGDAQDSFDVCLYVFNTYPGSLELSLNVVDGAITNDALQNKACKDEDTKDALGQYAVFSGDQSRFVLDGESVIQTNVTIDVPEYYAGKYYGCVTARIYEEERQTEGMFTIVNRLGYPFELILDGDLQTTFAFRDFDIDPLTEKSGYTVWGAKNIVALVEKNNEIIAHLAADNQGNIPQDVMITGQVTLWKGYPRQRVVDFDGYDQQILPRESSDIMMSLGMLPRYGAPVTLDLTSTHQPVLDFESDRITDEMQAGGSYETTVTYRAMPNRLRYVGYLLVALIAWFVFRHLWFLITGKRRSRSTVTKEKKQKVVLSVEEYEKLKKATKKKSKKKKKKD